ncbi:unnamed protein product, partial [marine sediment metagenome]
MNHNDIANAISDAMTEYLHLDGDLFRHDKQLPGTVLGDYARRIRKANKALSRLRDTIQCTPDNAPVTTSSDIRRLASAAEQITAQTVFGDLTSASESCQELETLLDTATATNYPLANDVVAYIRAQLVWIKQ